MLYSAWFQEQQTAFLFFSPGGKEAISYLPLNIELRCERRVHIRRKRAALRPWSTRVAGCYILLVMMQVLKPFKAQEDRTVSEGKVANMSHVCLSKSTFFLSSPHYEICWFVFAVLCSLRLGSSKCSSA